MSMKNRIVALIVFINLITMSSCGQSTVQDLKLDSQIDSISYSLGVLYAQNLSRDGLDSLNPWLIAKAFEDLNLEKEFLIDAQEAEMILRAYFTKIQEQQLSEQYDGNKADGEKFLEENKSKEGVVVLPSGLQYSVLKEGSGTKPSAADVVKVYYKGWFIDGKVFEETPEGEPVSFPVTQVIRGWTEALQLMNVGSKWRLFIPYDLAYGTEYRQGSPIVPFSALIFDVELLGID